MKHKVLFFLIYFSFKMELDNSESESSDSEFLTKKVKTEKEKVSQLNYYYLKLLLSYVMFDATW